MINNNTLTAYLKFNQLIIIEQEMSASALKLNEEKPHRDQKKNLNSFLDKAKNIQSQIPLVRINADNQDPYMVCCFCLIQFVIGLLVLGLMVAVPPVFDHRDWRYSSPDQLTSCFNPIGFYKKQLHCQNFTTHEGIVGLIISNLKQPNHFITLYFHFTFKQNQLADYQIEQNISLKIDALEGNTEEIDDGSTKTTYTLIQPSIYKENIQLYINQQEIESFGTYKRDNESIRHGDELVNLDWRVGAEPKWMAEEDNYLVTVKFSHPNLLSPALHSVELKAVVLNSHFLHFSIFLRYVFFLTSLLTGILYIRRLYDIPSKGRTFQHRFLMLSSIMLMLFNDPIYPATILVPNPFTIGVSVLVVVSFVVCMLSMSLLFLHRIYQEEGSRTTKLNTFPHWILFTCLYFALTILNFVVIEDSASIPPNSLFLRPVQIFVLFPISVCFLWMLVMYGLICCSYRRYLWRSWIFVAYSLFFVIITMLCIISYAFWPFVYPSHLLLGYVYVNIYIYVLQYIYYVPEEALKQARENQADSKEESIILGVKHLNLTSEKEVTRQTSSFI